MGHLDKHDCARLEEDAAYLRAENAELRKEHLEYRELKRNRCDVHQGARVHCGQCFDSQGQHLRNARAEVERLRRALEWALDFDLPNDCPRCAEYDPDTLCHGHRVLLATPPPTPGDNTAGPGSGPKREPNASASVPAKGVGSIPTTAPTPGDAKAGECETCGAALVAALGDGRLKAHCQNPDCRRSP